MPRADENNGIIKNNKIAKVQNAGEEEEDDDEENKMSER